MTHWFWWQGAAATYADQAEAIHVSAELVTRTEAETEQHLAAVHSRRMAIADAVWAVVLAEIAAEGRTP